MDLTLPEVMTGNQRKDLVVDSFTAPVQMSLFQEGTVETDRYGRYVTNPILANILDALEDKFPYKDESHFFANLVNPSKSKFQPFHRWARYREGYSGNLVAELIRRSGIEQTKHFVIDPMCGSGTTVLESVQNGFNSVGLDVNPFATDLSGIKLRTYSAVEIKEIEAFVANTLHLQDPTTMVAATSGQSHCKEYFNSQHYDELLRLKAKIETCRHGQTKDFLNLAWLTILEECSNRKKDGNGLATAETRVTDVEAFYKTKVQIMLADIKDNPIPSAESLIANEPVKHLARHVADFESRTNQVAGAIIFSPPYANSFDYFESYKLELLFGGYCDFEGLQTLRQQAIRSYRISYGYQLESNNNFVTLLCEEIMNAVPQKEVLTGKRDTRTRLVPNLLKGYFIDMEEALATFSKVLQPGGKCFIVVDQSAYVGVIVPTDLVLASIAESYGFMVESIVKCRNANTSGQQLTRFPYLKKMLRESIVCLVKKETV